LEDINKKVSHPAKVFLLHVVYLRTKKMIGKEKSIKTITEQKENFTSKKSKKREN